MLVVVTELLTAKLLKSPTLVMLGCAAWDTTRATLAFATFPTRLALCTLLRAFPPPLKNVAVMFPDE